MRKGFFFGLQGLASTSFSLALNTQYYPFHHEETILNLFKSILLAPLFLTLLSACPAAVPDPVEPEEKVCDTGYTLDGDECIDDDECAADESPCGDNATCTNTDGAHECACDTGYDGDGTDCADIDECATDNGGCAQTCTNTDGAFECGCEMGYTLNADGAACDDNDECSRENGGCEQNCTNSDGFFTCSCDDGYALNADGINCDDVDECATDNGGCEGTSVCANSEGSFECTCTDGYHYGTPMATDADAGADSGMDCVDTDECTDETDDCQDTSTCSNTMGSFECLCGTGYYYGEVASTGADAGPATMACLDFNDCTAADCASGGDTAATCTDAVAPEVGFACTCGTGYTDDGTTCTDTDACAAADCTTGGDTAATCTDGTAPDTEYTCNCATGFTDDGMACADVDECATDNGGCAQTCTNSTGSFTCSCDEGYTLNTDGLTCDNIDECTEGTDTCAGSSTCSDTMGSYECLCAAGYEYGEVEGTDGGMGGMDCIDVDECLAYDAVSFTKPDGEHDVQDCINDNVCLARGNNGSLYNGAVETSAAGGGCSGTTSPAGTQWAWGACLGNTNEWSNFLSATGCNPRSAIGFTMCLHLVDSDTYYNVVIDGYTGGGGGGGFAYTRTLVSGGPCGEGDAECTNDVGSFTCSCSEGFEADTDGNCVDIDECVAETDSCTDNADCANNLGGHSCTCADGYVGGGNQNCYDIDECANGFDNCSDFATCENTEGSFICECIAPATGDGITCDVVCDPACGSNSSCGVDAENNTAICVCNEGYSEDAGGDCVETDRCLEPPTVDFLKPNYSSAADCITPNICIGRRNAGSLYNVIYETSANGYDSLYNYTVVEGILEGDNESPIGTLWYQGSCAAAKSDGYISDEGIGTIGDYDNSIDGFQKAYNVDRNHDDGAECLFLPAHGLFFDFSVYYWQDQGLGGGFGYTRTPYNPVDGAALSTACGHSEATCTWENSNVSCVCPAGFTIDNNSGMCEKVHTCDTQPCGAGATCRPTRMEPLMDSDTVVKPDHQCECDAVEFSKPPYQTETQDCITPDVCLARNDNGPLYNSIYETYSAAGDGGCTAEPTYTTWTYKTCQEAHNDDFGPFFSSFIDRCEDDTANGLDLYPYDMPGLHGCLRTHVPADNSISGEWDIQFTTWTPYGDGDNHDNGGGFGYTRWHERADGEACSD
jgi:hypothetical protein